MSQHFKRKPGAVVALVASSIGSVLAGTGAAQATTYGAVTSPVTITANGVINVVGGGTVALPAGAHDVSWAGQAGRFAFIGADNGIYTADFDGTHVIKIAQGSAPSHTVWDEFNYVVYWTEGTGASAKVVYAAANGDWLGSQQPTVDLLTTPLAGLGLSNADVAADNGNSVVVQTTDASGNNGVSVVFDDATGKQSVTQIVAPGTATTGGSAPTISPDGTTVVFVRTDASGDKQLFASSFANNAWSTPKQISWMTGDHTTPIYEGDNATVAFEFTNRPSPVGSNANGTYQVNVAAALGVTGSHPELEKNLSALSGGLAVRTDRTGHVYRFAGNDRFDTAVMASHQAWRTLNAPVSDMRRPAQSVVLSRSDDFADALGGAALASHSDGPLLLTSSAALNAETQAEIQRILPAGGTVHVLGGTAAISPAVVAKLTALGYTVDRVAGQNRFETAVAIANRVDPNATDILVATGTKFADALSAGAAAAKFQHTVVVLTNGTSLPAATDAYLQSKANSGQLKYLAAIGGAANTALSSQGWQGFDQLVGADRYQTSYLVAHKIFGGFSSIGVATGLNWPDSLSGGAFMGLRGGPLLLVDPNVGLTPEEDAMIDANRGADNRGYVFGGLNALPLHVDGQLSADVATATGSVQGPGSGATIAAVTPNVTKS